MHSGAGVKIVVSGILDTIGMEVLDAMVELRRFSGYISKRRCTGDLLAIARSLSCKASLSPKLHGCYSVWSEDAEVSSSEPNGLSTLQRSQ